MEGDLIGLEFPKPPPTKKFSFDLLTNDLPESQDFVESVSNERFKLGQGPGTSSTPISQRGRKHGNNKDKGGRARERKKNAKFRDTSHTSGNPNAPIFNGESKNHKNPSSTTSSFKVANPRPIRNRTMMPSDPAPSREDRLSNKQKASQGNSLNKLHSDSRLNEHTRISNTTTRSQKTPLPLNHGEPGNPIKSGPSMFLRREDGQAPIKSAYGLEREAEFKAAHDKNDDAVQKGLEFFRQKLAQAGNGNLAKSGHGGKTIRDYKKDGDTVLKARAEAEARAPASHLKKKKTEH